MFFRKGASKLINYFLLPFLDYKSSHRSRLNKKWPFYTERDQKQKSTIFSYGTVFSSSHWTTKIVNITKSNLDISIKLYPENFVTVFYTNLTKVLSFATQVTSHTKSLYYILIFYILSKFVLTPFIINFTYSTDPDLLYDTYFLFEYFVLVAYYSVGYALIWVSSVLLGNTVGSRNIVPKTNYSSKEDLTTYSVLGPKQFRVGPVITNTNLNLKTEQASANNLTYFLNFFSNNMLDLVDYSQLNQLKLSFYLKLPDFLTEPKLKSYGTIRNYIFLCTRYTQPSFTLNLRSGTDLLNSQFRYRAWNPETLSLCISKFTSLVKEGMWFIKNFPATSSLNNNTKLFTNSKKLINVPLRDYKGVGDYGIRKYKGYKTLIKKGSLLRSLSSKHFSFFERSRFFSNNRSLLTSTLNSVYSLVSPLLKYLPNRVVNLFTSASCTDFLLLQKQTIDTNEPYHPKLTYKGSVLFRLPRGNSTDKYTQTLTDNSMFSRSDLLFTELLNSTNTSVTGQNYLSSTPMNFTVVKSKLTTTEDINQPNYYPPTLKL